MEGLLRSLTFSKKAKIPPPPKFDCQFWWNWDTSLLKATQLICYLRICSRAYCSIGSVGRPAAVLYIWTLIDEVGLGLGVGCENWTAVTRNRHCMIIIPGFAKTPRCINSVVYVTLHRTDGTLPLHLPYFAYSMACPMPMPCRNNHFTLRYGNSLLVNYTPPRTSQDAPTPPTILSTGEDVVRWLTSDVEPLTRSMACIQRFRPLCL